MEDKNYGILAIVAIVAIVGLIVMISGVKQNKNILGGEVLFEFRTKFFNKNR